MYIQLLENILGNAEDIDEPGCSYETGRSGQKRKGETIHTGKSKKTKGKISKALCIYLFCKVKAKTF